jgi:Flp pilus assembly secretin CpaC
MNAARVIGSFGMSSAGDILCLMKCVLPGILTFLLLSVGELHAQPNTALAGTQNTVVYPSIAVAVNKAVVIRSPRKATKVAVSQPKIAEVEIVSPDTLLVHGRAVGATSLVIWFEER